MDTDDLTEMAYHTIRLGNDAHDVLKTEIGEFDIDEFKKRLSIFKNHMERTLNIPIKYRGRSDLGNDSENKAVEGT